MAMQAVKLLPVKLATKQYEVKLSAECYARLTRLHHQVVTGKSTGGWQTLIRDLYQQIASPPVVDAEGVETQKAVLVLSEGFLHRLIPPAVRYDSGGYQQVIRWVLCQLLDQYRTQILGMPQTLKTMIENGKG